MDDAIFARYELLHTGKLNDLPPGTTWLMREKAPVDQDHDSRIKIGVGTYAVFPSGPGEVDDEGKPAYRGVGLTGRKIRARKMKAKPLSPGQPEQAAAPFPYFPLQDHFEQRFHVAGRLARHGAGVRLEFRATTSDRLAATVLTHISQPAHYPPISSDGAQRAAELLLCLLRTNAGQHSSICGRA